MGIYINKTNTDKLLRKIINNHFNNDRYGIYSNQCFDDLEGNSITIVSPAKFNNLLRGYCQAVQQNKMQWKQLVDAFYQNELLPFAHVKRSPNGLKILYHGSETQFDPNAIQVSNPYDNSMKNGHADGYGIYLTTDINTALRYGHYIYLYLWNPNRLKVRKISEVRNTLPRDFYHELFIKLNDEDEFLSNYGDIDYEGLDTVMSYAMENLDDNDVDNINSIINAGGSADTVIQYLAKYGYGYTVNKQFNDQIIVYNKDLIIPYNRLFNSQLGNPVQRG